jgi:hypothetical protein
MWPNDPERLLSVAEELALTSTVFAADSNAATSAEQCAQWSIATLREAVAAGLRLPPDLDRRESFAALRGRPDFIALIAP